MNKVMVLRGPELIKALHGAAAKHISAIISYLSNGKWYVAKVHLDSVQGDSIRVESNRSRDKQHPVNVQLDQPVGISYKYEYGKFVFDSTVTALDPSPNPQAGGRITLTIPEQIEVIQRRSYFRVNVPESLKVNIVLWHRKSLQQENDRGKQIGPTSYCNARLVDISAGGAQIVIDTTSCENWADFKKGQFVGMRFTPLPYETPLMLNTQIRNVLPEEDGKSIYLGAQLVGLEASPEGHDVLARLVEVIERYHKMNQANTKTHDAKHAEHAA